MFGTLHCKSHTKEAEFIERPHGSLDPEKISACDRCRAKKVKCSTTYGGCSRCKRLGKTCTFIYTKYKGDQRKRKTSVNTTQQERSLGFLFQSSTPSGSEDIGREERVYSDKRPFKSLPTADGNVDDSERGQQLLAEPLIDRLADSPQDFLVEFQPQNNDRDGDYILNLSLPPSPFFSTILPSTHPEPIQPTTTTTSDSFLTPPMSSGDEIPCYLPPTKQSQGSYLFENGSNTTLISLHASTLVSRAFSYQNPSGQSCQCLSAVVFAVEELEASCNSGNRSDLDSIVAYKKEAIKCCRSILMCGSCMVKRENLVLLVFITEKIVAACGRIVVLYRVENCDTRAGSAPSPLLGSSPLDRLSHRVNIEDRDPTTSASSTSSKTECTHSGSMTSVCTGASSDWQELLLGDYEISSLLEWEHVVRVLIFLQLRELLELLADMKEIGSNILGETQMAGLAQAEIQAANLKREMYTI